MKKISDDIKYKIGNKVWLYYPSNDIKRRGIITHINDDDVTVKFKYWNTEIEMTFRDFEITQFTYDDYINDFQMTTVISNIKLNIIESYIRKNKLETINNNFDTNISENDKVLQEFDIKYIEEYIKRINKK
jgi:hypothetical protein